MKNKVLLLILIFSSVLYAQSDNINKQRYEVINAIYKNLNIEKYGKAKLDEKFFPFLGLGVIISDIELIDNLLGHCVDYDKKEMYSYSDILNQKEITKMRSQISAFGSYKFIDSSMISEKIKISKDDKNSMAAITLPLVYNNKAIVYRTNKNNGETLFVLVKIENEWIVRCRKNLYQRIDDQQKTVGNNVYNSLLRFSYTKNPSC